MNNLHPPLFNNDPEKSKDPGQWLVAADSFKSAAHLLWRPLKDGFTDTQNPFPAPEIYSASGRALPTNIATAAELYLKGYLVASGEDPAMLREEHEHNLESLRMKCAEKDASFDQESDLIHLTQVYGQGLVARGGIRYPDNSVVPIFEGWLDALDFLREKLKGKMGAAESRESLAVLLRNESGEDEQREQNNRM